MQSQSWDTSGYRDIQDHIRGLIIEPGLETIENIFHDRDYTVTLRTDEMSSICPKTGLPDFATLLLSYRPAETLVEEKSLKLYLTSYRNLGIFQEHATNKILADFVEAVKPRWAKIEADWKSRGGIGVRIVSEWSRERGFTPA